MRKYLSIFLVLAMILTCFAACGSKDAGNAGTGNQTGTETSSGTNGGSSAGTESTESAEKSFTYAMEYDISSLDPQNSGDTEAIVVNRMINEGLLRKKGIEVVPGLATEWNVSDDGLTYTFKLRESVWSDGTPVTADDFVYSWQRMCDPNFPTYFITECEFIENGLEVSNGLKDKSELGVEAPDDLTLVVHLCKRDNNFLYKIADNPAWLPISQAADEAAGGLGPYGSELGKFLTNGPFNVVEWSHESYIVLEKNPLFWDSDEIKLTRVKGIVGATGASAVDMMQAGEIDYMTTNIKKESQELEDAGFVVEKYTGAYRYLYFNGDPRGKTEASDWMKNTHFRRALNYVVNRVAFSNVLSLDCEPAYRVIMPSEPGLDGRTIHEMYPYTAWDINGDVAKAKEELQLAMNELGVSDVSAIPPLYLLGYESEDTINLLTAFQDTLKQQLGIESTVNPQAIQAMREIWHTGCWDVFVMDWGFSSPNWGIRATNWYRYEGDPDEHNDNGYNCDEFNAAFEAYRNAESQAAALEALVECERIFCEDAASACLAWTNYCCCYNSKITGILLGSEADFTFADVTE